MAPTKKPQRSNVTAPEQSLNDWIARNQQSYGQWEEERDKGLEASGVPTKPTGFFGNLSLNMQPRQKGKNPTAEQFGAAGIGAQSKAGQREGAIRGDLQRTQQNIEPNLPLFGQGPGGGQAMTPLATGSSTGGWQQGPAPLPGMEKAIGLIAGREKQAETDIAGIETELGEAEAAGVAGVRGEMQTLEERSAAKQASIQQERDTELSYYQAMRQQAADEKINPDAWWESRSTAQKVMGLIGVALGAFGEGFTGGRMRNAALAIIDKEIDRELKSQVANMNKRKGERQESINLVGTLTNLLKDEELGLQNAKVMLLQNLSLQMREKAAGVKNRRVAADLMITLAAIDKKALVVANDIHMKRGKTRMGSTTKKQFTMIPAAGGGGAGGRPIKDMQFLSKWQGRLSLIGEIRDIANDARGKSLTPINELFSWFGTDSARRSPRIRMIGQLIGRKLTGAESGAMSNQDVARMIENTMGKEWNKSGAVYENLTRIAKKAEDTMRNEVYSYRHAGFDVNPLLRGLFQVPGAGGQQAPAQGRKAPAAARRPARKPTSRRPSDWRSGQ